MKNLPVLKGKNICLRALLLKDAEGDYPHWLNDPEVTKYNSHGETCYTRKMAEEYIAMVTESDSYHVFAIVQNETEKHIGNISLQALDPRARSAEFAILIGDPSVYGTGIGQEAGRLLLAYGFVGLKLHRIYCGTSSENAGMQKLALKLWMRQEGIRRDALTKNGRFVDIIEYGILEDEYKETL